MSYHCVAVSAVLGFAPTARQTEGNLFVLKLKFAVNYVVLLFCDDPHCHNYGLNSVDNNVKLCRLVWHYTQFCFESELLIIHSYPEIRK